MLKELISSGVSENFNIGTFIMVLLCALVLGFIISAVYIITHKSEGYVQSFPITLIMLPATIALIILLVSNSVASALGVAGAFSLVRFRSAPGDPKDIAYIFVTVAVGLACGMNCILFAAIFAIVMCSVMIILTVTNYGHGENNSMNLRIAIPENLNYQTLFDDILKKYTKKYALLQVKTSDYGALFEVKYNVELKSNINQKAFLDELRCRNGNLNIILTQREFETKVC